MWFRALMVVAGLLWLSGASAEEAEKRYPPYPDVWGIDLPHGQGNQFEGCGEPWASLYQEPDGELRFLGSGPIKFLAERANH